MAEGVLVGFRLGSGMVFLGASVLMRRELQRFVYRSKYGVLSSERCSWWLRSLGGWCSIRWADWQG